MLTPQNTLYVTLQQEGEEGEKGGVRGGGEEADRRKRREY